MVLVPKLEFMAAFHGCHTTLHYLNLYHSPYEAPMVAYHHPHYQSYGASMAALHNCKTTLHYHPQHHLEFSSTTEDHLEAALAKLTLSQHSLVASIDTLAHQDQAPLFLFFGFYCRFCCC